MFYSNVGVYLQAFGSKTIFAPYTVEVYNPVYGEVADFYDWEDVESSGNGTVVGRGVYDLLPNLGNDININFNVEGPQEAAAYHPTAVILDGDECLQLN